VGVLVGVLVDIGVAVAICAVGDASAVGGTGTDVGVTGAGVGVGVTMHAASSSARHKAAIHLNMYLSLMAFSTVCKVVRNRGLPASFD
jgi:hypothetical protein